MFLIVEMKFHATFGAVLPISKSLISSVVSLTHRKAPQQQLKFLQLDFKLAFTTNPKNAKNAPDSVSQNGLSNVSYHILLFHRFFNVSAIAPLRLSRIEHRPVKLADGLDILRGRPDPLHAVHWHVFAVSDFVEWEHHLRWFLVNPDAVNGC